MPNLFVRHATSADTAAIAELEAMCFPPTEVASYASFESRISVFPDRFWLLFEDGRLVSMVEGFLTNDAILHDCMFADATLHDPIGRWQMIFGVATCPDRQRHGYAGLLLKSMLEQCQREGRAGVVLTCKPAKIAYYAKFGFVDEGVSESEHGGEIWHQMRIEF